MRQQVLPETPSSDNTAPGKKPLDLFLDTLPYQAWAAGPGGTIDGVNKPLLSYSGCSREELLSQGWEALVHPNERSRVLRQWERAVEAKETFDIKCRLRALDGTYQWHRVRALPKRNSEGEVLKWFGTNTGIDRQQERKQASSNLQRVEERFQVLFDNATDAIVSYPLTSEGPGQFTDVNEAAVELLGYSREKLLTMSPSDLITSGTYPPHLIKELKETGSIRHQLPVISSDGRERPVEIHAQLFEWQGQPMVLSIGRDVSEQTRAQEWLSGQKHILEMVATATPLNKVLQELCLMIEGLEPNLRACVLVLDRDQQQFDRAIGPSFSQEYTTSLAGIPAGPPYVGSCASAVFNGEPVVSFDVANDERWRKDWRNLSVQNDIKACRSTPICSSDGTPLGSFMLCFSNPEKMHERIPQIVELGTHLAGIALERQAIESDRKYAQKALQESEERFRAVAENAVDIIATVDSHTKVQYVSPSIEEVLGYTSDELTHQKLLDYLLSEDLHKARNKFAHVVFSPDSVASFTLRFQHKNGQIRHLSIKARNMKDRPGIKGLLLNIRDVTDVKRYEAELIEAKEAAEKMTRLKSNLLANMSHEIRTPLTGIIGLATSLQRRVSDECQKDVQLIERSGKRLTNTLNSVLTLAQLEGDGLSVEPEIINVSAEATDITDSLTQLATEKGLLLEFTSAAPKAKASLDPAILDRILNNLVGNAIKFTEQGGVQVTVEATNDKVEISVQDTGVGISKEFIPHLFEEFKQESTGFSRSHEGTGLGLVLTKKMVEVSGGTISVESVKGEGSTFTVTFPKVNDSEQDVEEAADYFSSAAPPQLEGSEQTPSVLLAEDNEIIRRMVAEAGEKHGFSVQTSADAASTLHQASQQVFDLVLLDVSLPDMDGTEVLQQLRSTEQYAKVPILAVTGHALPGDKERLLEEGFTAFLPKPFTSEELVAAIEACLAD